MKLGIEALRSAFAQPVASTITSLIVAGVCAVILSTTGQTVEAEQQVLSQIDAAGTRSVVISDTNGDAGITVAAVDRIERLTGVEWVIGLGPATDARAAGIPQGNPAAVRSMYGDVPAQVHVTGRFPNRGEAVVGPEAQRILGLQQPIGGVISDQDLAVVGEFEASDPLAFLNRSLIRAPNPGETGLRSIHILVTKPSLVAQVADAAALLVGPDNPGSVAIQTSETLANIRAAVAGELGRFSRRLVAIVLAASLVLTALAVYGAVSSRRRDFGRRRALGASRLAIIALVALQTAIAATIGAVAGTAVTWFALTGATGQSPDPRFTLAIGILAILTGVVAAMPPALVAAFRDPVRVLRVP